MQKKIIDFKNLSIYSILISCATYFFLTPDILGMGYNSIGQYAIFVRILILFISFILMRNFLSKKRA